MKLRQLIGFTLIITIGMLGCGNAATNLKTSTNSTGSSLNSKANISSPTTSLSSILKTTTTESGNTDAQNELRQKTDDASAFAPNIVNLIPQNNVWLSPIGPTDGSIVHMLTDAEKD